MHPSAHPPHDLAATVPFGDELVTAKFTRMPVDAKDTVPVELYARHPATMCLTARANLVAPDHPPALPPRHRQPRLSLVIAMLCGTFALGVVIGFLMV